MPTVMDTLNPNCLSLKVGDIVERTAKPYGNYSYDDADLVVNIGDQAQVVEVRSSSIRARILGGSCKGEVHVWHFNYIQPVQLEPNWEI